MNRALWIVQAAFGVCLTLYLNDVGKIFDERVHRMGGLSQAAPFQVQKSADVNSANDDLEIAMLCAVQV